MRKSMIKGIIGGMGETKAGLGKAIPHFGNRAKSSAMQGTAQLRNRSAKKVGDVTSRAVRNSPSTTDTLYGRGMQTMKKNKVRTGLIVGSGMGVAASVRSHHRGVDKGSTSMYRY